MSRRRFVLEAVLLGLVGGAFGAGLLLAFGSPALAVWGLMAVTGLLTGILIVPVWQKFISAPGDIAAPADLRWNKRLVVTGGTVVGAVISIALAGEFWTPFEAAAQSLIALLGPSETGIVSGTATRVFPTGLLRMLRATNSPAIVQGTLAGISSGVGASHELIAKEL